jgi:hypothetical protein
MGKPEFSGPEVGFEEISPSSFLDSFLLPTLPANLCSVSRVPISRGSMTHALYATFRFRAQAQSNSM